MRSHRSALLALVLSGWTSISFADGGADEAARAFAAGRSAYSAGRWVEAARHFERANGLAPHPAALYNAATAWDQAGDLARAADSFEVALRGELDQASRDGAKKRLKELEAQVGVLEVTAPAGAKLSADGRSFSEFPARFHLPPGTQVLEITLPDGGSHKKQIEVVAGVSATLDLGAPQPATSSRDPAPVAPSSDERAWRIAGWAGVGLSAGLAVTSALLWSAAKSEKDDLIAGDASARGRARTLQTWTNVTLVSSVALGAAGVTVLVMRPGRSAGSATLRLQLGQEISVSGSF